MKKEKKLMIIDYSSVFRRQLGSLFGPRALTKPDELSEVVFRVADAIRIYHNTFKPDVTIIAMDYRENGHRQYWREKYLINWYIDNIEIAYDSLLREHYLRIDNRVFKMNTNSVGEYVLDKKALLANNVPKLNWTLAKDSVPYGALESLVPKYKGNRSNAWEWEFSKVEFYASMNSTAETICKIIPSCYAICAEDAEADDICAVVSSKHKGDSIIVSGDGDMKQLVKEGVDVYYIKDSAFYERLSEAEREGINA